VERDAQLSAEGGGSTVKFDQLIVVQRHGLPLVPDNRQHDRGCAVLVVNSASAGWHEAFSDRIVGAPWTISTITS
jgi:hypothetical protein